MKFAETRKEREILAYLLEVCTTHGIDPAALPSKPRVVEPVEFQPAWITK